MSEINVHNEVFAKMFVFILVLLFFDTSQVVNTVARDDVSILSSRNLTIDTIFHERFTRQTTCKSTEWQCGDGTCISSEELCDGDIDCPDDSDETLTECKKEPSNPALEHCELPPDPEHGRFVGPDNDLVHSFSQWNQKLMVSCDKGYGVVGNNIVFCLNGSWSPIPECVQLCKLEPHFSVRYYCNISGSPEARRACSTYEYPGSTVTPECNKPDYYSKAALPLMLCNDGKWNYIAVCEPVCGRLTPKGMLLAIGGTQARRAEIPWHVAIYHKPIERKNFYELICGGSLVSNSLVISAAHCFWHHNKQKSAHWYNVAAAKLYREWDHEEDKEVQKSEIKEIHLPPLFVGSDTNFQEDIALLILETPIVYHPYVRPVCLSFDYDFNNRQLKPGNVGKVAGWGLTENGLPSEILNVVDLPLVSTQECIARTPFSFTELITADKICAGYTNGTAALCRGDSGGGLSFPEPDGDSGVVRYYLRGIVSSAPKSDQTGKWCNEFALTTFTQIMKHEHFINDYITSAGTVPSARCILPPYPKHGSYVMPNEPYATPGDGFKFAQLNITCDQGYGVVGDNVIICLDGTWSRPMPECTRHCKLDSHPSVSYHCVVTGRVQGRRPCDPYEPSGTIVLPECFKPIYFSPSSLPSMKCIDGSWDYVAICRPECGRMTPTETVLDNGGMSARGELPWHVAIYRKNDSGQNIQLCAGSLVTEKIVISAAHCYWNDVSKKQPASLYSAAVGKLFKEWRHKDDQETEQNSKIKSIELPPRFQGVNANYQEDIAILTLSSPFSFNTFVRPVCVDFDFNFDKRQLMPGNLGKVGGWSFRGNGITPNKFFKVVDLPYVDIQTCIDNSPYTFREYITSDKICAGYANGTAAICRGDSGGGLSFPVSERGTDRYYLRGVVSTAPRTDEECNIFAVTAFTHIFNHANFIKNFL